MVYRDFDVLFERAGECYQIKVLNSPAGQTTGQFKLPFSELELENLLLRVGRPRRGVRRIDSPEMDAVKQFGGRLFESVFDGEVGQCLRASLDEVEQKEHGLRLRLRLTDVPELADLPWEYIYNPSLNRFLSLSISSPIVRYLELSVRHRPLEVKPPLRVLVMISSPYNFPKLDVEQEWAKLKHAFAEFEKDGQVVLERMENATLATLQRHLRKKRYHIFHFMGHAGFVQQAQDGVLILEDEQDRGRPVSAQYLGTLLHDHPSLRLALLNACEGARASRNDPFSGTAQSLVQQGLPAVIAMQFEVTDEASITFSQWFYEFLAKGHPVDECLSEARKAIFTQGNDIEWGTPVLYMRSPDGRIFDIQPRTEEKKTSTQAIRPISPTTKRYIFLSAAFLLIAMLSVFFNSKYGKGLLNFSSKTTVSITTHPEDAHIYLNEKYIGDSPLNELPLASGSFALKVIKQGFESRDTTFTLDDGEAVSLPIKLMPLAKLAVTVNPENAHILLDGKKIAQADLQFLELAAGIHLIEISHEGYKSISDTIFLSQGDNPPKEYYLSKRPNREKNKKRPMPAPQTELAEMGKIKFYVRPFGSIYIDDKLIKKDAFSEVTSELPVGQYRVRVQHPKWGVWEETVAIQPDGLEEIKIDFYRFVKVRIAATDESGDVVFAMILVDSKPIGYTTPQEITVRVGKHSIGVVHKDYEVIGKAQAINFNDDIKEPLVFTLRKVNFGVNKM